MKQVQCEATEIVDRKRRHSEGMAAMEQAYCDNAMTWNSLRRVNEEAEDTVRELLEYRDSMRVAAAAAVGFLTGVGLTYYAMEVRNVAEIFTR